MATNREVFDAIASTWYGVRHWPLLRRELDDLAQRWRGGRLANLGSGTGADFLPFSDRFRLVGLDCSRGMLRQSLRHMEKHGTRADLVQGELTHLPFPDASFDYAIGIACYHHIEGAEARAHAFSELGRILRPEGEAFISVWNHDQPRFHGTPQDQHVPWRDGVTTLQRYYHLFTRKEMQTALEQCGFQTVRIGHAALRNDVSREDTRNICALVRTRASTSPETTHPESEEPG